MFESKDSQTQGKVLRKYDTIEGSLFHLNLCQNVVFTWDSVGLSKCEHNMRIFLKRKMIIILCRNSEPRWYIVSCILQIPSQKSKSIILIHVHRNQCKYLRMWRKGIIVYEHTSHPSNIET